MNAFLKRRSDVLSGNLPSSSSSSNRRERYITPATPASERGDLSPVVTALLAPHRRRGDPLPPPAEPALRPTPPRPSTAHLDPAREAQSRVSNERARAAALIAAKRKEALASSAGSSIASETPRSEWGRDMFNAEATREARDRRSGGVWGEQKRRRDERDRDRGWGGRR